MALARDPAQASEQRRRRRAALVALVLIAGTLVAAQSGPVVAQAAPSPIGAHSMLQLNDPPSFMREMFAEAAAMHASAIRVDVQPSIVFSEPLAPPDFTGLDEVVALSEQYHLRVVADLLSIPWWIADCTITGALADVTRCATNDLTGYQSMVAQIVTRAEPVISDWEIWNEPDNAVFFSGTPQQYALMLRSAYDAIKEIEPAATVLLGGMSGTSAMPWLAQVFATPGAAAATAFDVANVHERGRLDDLARDIAAWKQFFAGHGFTGPLWVTEHGYPSSSAYQYDSEYDSGLESQSAFLTASVPTMLDAGAQMVFVTERDNLSGQFASEGLLGGTVLDPPAANAEVIEKPSYYAITRLAGCYLSLGRDCPGPAPAPAPAEVSMPPTPLGSSSVSLVSVSNWGLEPLQLGQLLVAAPASGGPASSGLTIDGDACSGGLLEPRHSCVLGVRFTPGTGGPAAATLELPSDNGTVTVPVSAVAPSLSSLNASASALRAAGSAGRAGAIQTAVLELVNPLSASVRLGRPALTSSNRREFSMQADRCLDVTLDAGAACRLTVRFIPRLRVAARVTVTWHGTGDPLALTLALRPRRARKWSLTVVS